MILVSARPSRALSLCMHPHAYRMPIGCTYRVPVGRTPSLCVYPCVSLATARPACAVAVHPTLALPAWECRVPSACALAPPLLCVLVCAPCVAPCARARVLALVCVSVRAAYDL